MPEMERCLVVGGGTMGAGIAATALGAGFAVELVEASAELAETAAERVAEILDDGVNRGKRTRQEADAAIAALTVIASIAAAQAAPDVAIEAVPERVQLKRDVLAEMERLGPGLLASNTSSLSIDTLSKTLKQPERLIGLHFFNPVVAMALVEVVVGPVSTDRDVDAGVLLTRRLGKEPIVVRDSPGFASSRLGLALGLEAIRMVEEGVAEPDAIDTAMTLGYRHPVGPLRLTDIVGLDVRLAIAQHLSDTLGERFRPPELLERMVSEGRLGRKTGRGFYDWESEP